MSFVTISYTFITRPAELTPRNKAIYSFVPFREYGVLPSSLSLFSLKFQALTLVPLWICTCGGCVGYYLRIHQVLIQ